MNSLQLAVPLALPSANKYFGKHWNVLHQDKKKWQESVGMAFVIAKANGWIPIDFIPPCKEKRSIKITTYRKRLIDADNLSVKALLDALTRLELIKDDSPKWINLNKVRQLKCENDHEQTHIEIGKL